MENYRKIRIVVKGIRCSGCRKELKPNSNGHYSLNREGKTTGQVYCSKCAK